MRTRTVNPGLRAAQSPVFKALALCATLTAPREAESYSTRFTPTGRPFRWTSSAVTFRVDPASLSAMSGDALSGVRAAALTWTLAPKATRIEVALGGSGRAGHSAGSQSSNELIFYQSNYPVATQALAVTVVTSSAETGEIYDADVLVQATRYRFEQIGPLGLLSQPGAPFDFQSMATHEFGHVLGLGEDHDTPDATMFPTALPGAVSQRSLTMTDIESLAIAYADSSSVAAQGCSARVAPTHPRGWVCLAALAAAALLSSRTRTRARTRWGVTAGAALMVIGSAPVPTAQGYDEATVVDARSHTARGLIYTTAVLEQRGARREVTLLGGEFGGLRQDVLDAPSGADLERGVSVTLDGARVLSTRRPLRLQGLRTRVAESEE